MSKTSKIKRDGSLLSGSGQEHCAGDRYFRVMQHTADPIIIHDRHGNLVDVNNATSVSLGYSREELLAMNVVDIDTRFSQAELENVWERLKSEASPTLESAQRRKDGSIVPVELRFGLFEADHQELVIAIARDLTERKQAMEEVARKTAELEKERELGQLKDHFLSTMSHELKTPLALIVGFAELLEDVCPDKAIVNGIKEGSRRLTAHIENIIDYSALISGTLPLYLTEVNLGEIAGNAREIVRDCYERRGIDLQVSVAEETPVIQGDARRISQILLELLENAEKATPGGGRVGIRIAPVEAEVRIDVWDTGEGIPEKDFSRIWEAFSQLEAGNAFRSGGLGLGLTIVKKIVELHGGRVGLVSQVGRGSTFSVFLRPGCTD